MGIRMRRRLLLARQGKARAGGIVATPDSTNRDLVAVDVGIVGDGTACVAPSVRRLPLLDANPLQKVPTP